MDLWRSTTEVPTKYRPLAKFPGVQRLSVVVDEAVRAGDIPNAIESVSATHIRDVDFQSVFRGGDLPKGKSMACRSRSVTMTAPYKRTKYALWKHRLDALKENVAGEQRVAPPELPAKYNFTRMTRKHDIEPLLVVINGHFVRENWRDI